MEHRQRWAARRVCKHARRWYTDSHAAELIRDTQGKSVGNPTWLKLRRLEASQTSQIGCWKDEECGKPWLTFTSSLHLHRKDVGSSKPFAARLFSTPKGRSHRTGGHRDEIERSGNNWLVGWRMGLEIHRRMATVSSVSAPMIG